MINNSFYLLQVNIQHYFMCHVWFYFMPEFVLISIILIAILFCAFIPLKKELYNYYELKQSYIYFFLKKLIYIMFLYLFINIYILMELYSKQNIYYIISLYGISFEFNIFLMFCKVFIMLLFLIIIILSETFLIKEGMYSIEYLILTLNVLLASFFLISSNNFLSFYLSLEYLSLSLYGLCCFKGFNSILSIESGLKYFIIGSIGSGFFLLSFSYIYGVTGTLQFNEIINVTELMQIKLFLDDKNSFVQIYNQVAKLWLGLIIISFFIKLAVPPFHMWLPDVYEGCSLVTMFFFSVIPKITFIIIFFKIIYVVFYNYIDFCLFLSFNGGILCFIIGSFSAMLQLNLKRFFAYSSITNMGYILIALSNSLNETLISFFFFIFVYLLNVILFFAVIINIRKKNSNILLSKIEELSFLKNEYPFISFIFLINLLSMAGIPPLGGFWAKFLILSNIIHQQYMFFSIIFVLFAVISAIYYLNIIVKLYFNNKKNFIFLYKPKIVTILIMLFLVFINIFMIFGLQNILYILYNIHFIMYDCFFFNLQINNNIDFENYYFYYLFILKLYNLY